MFVLKKVAKKYREEYVLQDITITINKGLNFIVGASGSGKTTLLRIMCGMDDDFEGELTYCQKDMKELTEEEKSYLYQHVFGFVFQDFNLLEELSVLENILIPTYLGESDRDTSKVLKDLQLFELKDKKVKYLSGGQKQRVAIARELMKNPKVLFADEPTSALDTESAKMIMDILRTISKSRTVIMVTHDTSLLSKGDSVFELDKGELIEKPHNSVESTAKLKMKPLSSFSFNRCSSMAKANMKGNIGRFLTMTLSLLIAGVLLLMTMSGMVHKSGQKEFEQLLQTYGDSLLDIGLYGSFMDASGTDSKKGDKPNGDVNQNIQGLYDRYVTDDRVSFVTYLQAFDKIEVTLGGVPYKIESSGNTPVINRLVAGRMPANGAREVVIPSSLATRMGLSPEKAIGKEITFRGSIADWSSGKPVYRDTSTTVTIVGVMDTTVKYEYNGKVSEYTVDDSFLFSKAALTDMMGKLNLTLDKQNFLIRAKTAEDMIQIKDELNKQGIVPLGRFELVEDMVRLNQQTGELSGSASIIIGFISLAMIVALFLITGTMRKREYAIYKVAGFHHKHLGRLLFTEIMMAMIIASVLFLFGSPLINRITVQLFQVSILTAEMLFVGILLIIGVSIIAYLSTRLTYRKVLVMDALKNGDKS